MLKTPSPTELELDTYRQRRWVEAGRDPKRLVSMIRQGAKKIITPNKRKKNVQTD